MALAKLPNMQDALRQLLAPAEPEPTRITYTPSPTARLFILSKKFINVIYSPRGEGKTTSGLFATVYHAMQQPESVWPLRWALIRDTRRNIGLTTARTVEEWFPKPHSYWRGKVDEPETITLLLNEVPLLTFDCFGVDSPQDMSRFQSYEASGGIWIEEPAPAATNSEFISSGISEKVLAVAITSVRGAQHPRIQLSFNPPAANHWTAQLFHLPGYEEIGDIEAEMPVEQRQAREWIRSETAVFAIPPGENKALDEKTPGYRERNRMALLATGATDLVARLVEGRVGYAKMGEAVTPAFCGLHIAPGLQVIPNRPAFIAWDYGLWPAAIVAQVAPSGHLLIHAAFVMENAGVTQLIEKKLQPWLQLQPLKQWIHIGGYEATEREQSNSEESALKTTLSLLGGRFIPGPVSWATRREACHDALTRYLGNIPWVRVSDRNAAQLVRCLDGGWHYPTDISGNVNRELPEKRGTMPSLGDAFAHLVAVLLRKSPQRSTDDPFGNKEKRNARPTRVTPYGSGYRGTRTGA